MSSSLARHLYTLAALTASLGSVAGCDGDASTFTDEVESKSSALLGPTPAKYQTYWTSSFFGSHGTLLGDTDADGKADLAGMGDGYVGLIRSTGSAFGAYQDWSGGSFFGSHGTLMGDITGTKKAELVGLGDGYVGVLRANGVYQTWWSASFFGSRANLLGDVTGDGKADLVGAGDGYVGVLRSTGSNFGGYETWLSTSFFGTRGTFLADVDGDKKADLVAVNDGGVSVRLSTGSAFGDARNWFSGVSLGSHGTLLADVTGDGRADLIQLADNNVMVSVSTGVNFDFPIVWYAGAFYGSHGTLAGDVNGDGAADLVGMGDGYVGALISGGLRAFGYQAMSERFWGDKETGAPAVRRPVPTLLILAKFTTPIGVIDSDGNGSLDKTVACTPVGSTGPGTLAHSQSYYETMLFGTNDPSVNGWFRKMSNQEIQLRRDNTVVLDNVAGSWGTDDPAVLANLIKLASAKMNFSNWDDDRNNVVTNKELNIVVVSNYHAYCSQGWPGAMGANRHVKVGVNGVTVDGDVAALEENVSFDSACHEMSHSFGAIDMYDAGLGGGMSIMGTSTGTQDGTAQFALDAWHKFVLGWESPSHIVDLHAAAVTWVHVDGTTLVYDSSRSRREYTLLEPRVAALYQQDTAQGVVAFPVLMNSSFVNDPKMYAEPTILASLGSAAAIVNRLSDGWGSFSYTVNDANNNVVITRIGN